MTISRSNSPPRKVSTLSTHSLRVFSSLKHGMTTDNFSRNLVLISSQSLVSDRWRSCERSLAPALVRTELLKEWLMRTAVCLKGLEKQSSPNSTAEHTNTPRMLMEDRTHEWSDRPNYPPFALMSPAVNGGNDGGCTPRDQLGNTRLGVCDIGAVEFRVLAAR